MFENLSKRMKNVCSVTDILKVNVYLVDMEKYSIFNNRYIEFMGDHRPARSCVEVRRLPGDAQVEVEMVAGIK